MFYGMKSGLNQHTIIHFKYFKKKHIGPTTYFYIPPSPLYCVHFPGRIWIIIPEGGTWMGSWGWLMVSVCRGPVQCRLARLERLFTQPLRPDWEALFSHPGAFQRKPPAEAPRLRYTTLKTIHTASFPLWCCVPWPHTYYNNAKSQYGRLWHKHCMVFVRNLKVIFPCADVDSDSPYSSRYSLFLIAALLTAGEFGFSVCVIWLRKLEKWVFARGMSQLFSLFSSVRPEPSERCSAQGQTKPLSYSRLRKRSG